jgi:hypothetical protein
MLVTSFSAPSAVWASAMPSLALRIALAHAANLRGHRGGDGHAGGIVLGAVDALAGRQALHRGAEHLVGRVEALDALMALILVLITAIKI